MRGARAAWAAVMTAAMTAPCSAQARAATFNLPAQSAVTAIPEFARQAGLQIVAPADGLGRIRTPALKGLVDVRQALDRLIARTGLEVAAADDRTITLRLAPPPRSEVRPAAAVSRPAATTEVEAAVVFGGGESRQVQAVRGADLDLLAPGSSPLRLLNKLPGVNLQSADAFGANEWSARISVRNFSQGRLGFTLDDVPLGDMTYANHNGLHASRAIIGENLASVELAQGPGVLETASSSNLGGTIKFASRAPSAEAGAFAAAALGSDRTRRLVLRLESGELSSGLRGYASYAYNTTDRWQGLGRQYAQQVNLKAVQPVGNGRLTGFLNLARRRESDPQDLSLEMIHRLGIGWDNIPNNWPLAVRIAEIGANRGETGVTPRNPEAGTLFPAPIASVDDAYYDATTARDDLLAGLTLQAPLGPRIDLKATAYGHWDKGQGLWWTPFVASPNYGVPGATADNAPISLRSTDYDIRRRGLLAAATAHLGSHDLSIGVWAEDNDFLQARRFFGLGLITPGRDYSNFQKNPFLTEWAYHFVTRTRQFYVQDSWTLNETLTATAGFKSLSIGNRAITRAGVNKDGKIGANETFLPRASLRYQPDAGNEVFANYGRGMRAFASSATSGPFAGDPSTFAALKDTLKPEISDSLEIGWRRNAADLTLLTAVYGVRFRNRLFSTPVGQGILGNPSTLANVGSVSAYGVETAASWRFAPGWAAFASYAFNHASYDDDVLDHEGRVFARTKGKLAVDAPMHLAKAHVDYARDGVFGRLALSYLSHRYFTFENDQAIPAQFLADLTAGYRFSGPGWREGLELQVNVTNLFDARYISTIGSNDFPVRGDAQTLLAGAPRQVFVTVRKGF